MLKRLIFYIFCLYDFYLYLPDILDLFDVDFFAPEVNGLLYFDAAMLLVGGIVLGILLRKHSGKFNNYLGLLMIVMNMVLTPWFLWRALP